MKWPLLAYAGQDQTSCHIMLLNLASSIVRASQAFFVPACPRKQMYMHMHMKYMSRCPFFKVYRKTSCSHILVRDKSRYARHR